MLYSYAVKSGVAIQVSAAYTRTMNFRRFVTALAVSSAVACPALVAQQPDSARVPTASLVGRVVSNIDSTAVRGADIRLVFLDSAHTARDSRGVDSLELFVDTTRSRVGVTDSTGAFAIRRLEAAVHLIQNGLIKGTFDAMCGDELLDLLAAAANDIQQAIP